MFTKDLNLFFHKIKIMQMEPKCLPFFCFFIHVFVHFLQWTAASQMAFFPNRGSENAVFLLLLLPLSQSLKKKNFFPLSNCRSWALPDWRGGAKPSLSAPGSARSPDFPAGVEGEFQHASRSASRFSPGTAGHRWKFTAASPFRSDHGGPRATSNRTPQTTDSMWGPKGRRHLCIWTCRKSE